MTIQELLGNMPRRTLKLRAPGLPKKSVVWLKTGQVVKRHSWGGGSSTDWHLDCDILNAILAAHAVALGVTSPDNKENETE